jgi:hypothetical protein
VKDLPNKVRENAGDDENASDENINNDKNATDERGVKR